jgi:hypothetical protein
MGSDGFRQLAYTVHSSHEVVFGELFVRIAIQDFLQQEGLEHDAGGQLAEFLFEPQLEVVQGIAVNKIELERCGLAIDFHDRAAQGAVARRGLDDGSVKTQYLLTGSSGSTSCCQDSRETATMASMQLGSVTIFIVTFFIPSILRIFFRTVWRNEDRFSTTVPSWKLAKEMETADVLRCRPFPSPQCIEEQGCLRRGILQWKEIH